MILPTSVSTGRGRPLALAVPAVLLALALGACGGDDSDGSAGSGGGGTAGDAAGEGGGDGSGAPSKDDFVARGNEICAEGNLALEAAGEDVDMTDPDAIPMFATEVLVPNIRGQLEEIRSLGFPEADDGLLSRTFDDASAALDEIESDPTLLAEETNPFDDVNTVLTDYGLTECGSE